MARTLRPGRVTRVGLYIALILGVLLLGTAVVRLSCAQTNGAREGGPIEYPSKLPGGRLIGKDFYSIVLPGNPLHGEEPSVDWEYGLWKYSLKTKRAELLTPYLWFPWLNHAQFSGILPDGQLLLHYQPWQEYEFKDEFRHVYIVNPIRGSLVRTVTLTAYDFDRFGMWGHVEISGEWAIITHPHFFKVLTVEELLNEEDSDYIVQIPLYVRKDGKHDLYPVNWVFPLRIADDGASPFLVLDYEAFGFRILDRDGHLLYQGGQVLPPSFLSGPTSVLPEGRGMADLFRLFYPPSMGMAVYMHVGWPQMSGENLIVFYDQYLKCIFICSPLGDFYEKVDRPEDTWKKRIADAGLTGEDGYMLLFEDGSTFVADYSDIAQQVRSGDLDPLGPLRELMGMGAKEK